MNDIKILYMSSIVSNVAEEIILFEFEFALRGRNRKQCYYLVNAVYSRCAMFVSTVPQATDRKERHFAAT